jgi:hypothetical protein
MLFEPSIVEPGELTHVDDEESRLERLVRMVGDTMPVVLVMVRSTPRHLQSIEWAIAELDDVGQVRLRGLENIWEPELVTDGMAWDVESFDSGIPVEPVVELQKQEGPRFDA